MTVLSDIVRARPKAIHECCNLTVLEASDALCRPEEDVHSLDCYDNGRRHSSANNYHRLRGFMKYLRRQQTNTSNICYYPLKKITSSRSKPVVNLRLIGDKYALLRPSKLVRMCLTKPIWKIF